MAPANIYEQQTSNRRKTVGVMMLFVCFVALLGFGFDTYILGFSFGEDAGRFGVSLPFATIAAVSLGSLSALWSLHGGSTSVLTSSGAQSVAPDDPRYRQLTNVVDEISIAAGLPRPRLYVIPDPDPNAFATGKDPEHASVAVTAGLLEKLDRDELQGVIAHEMSHVRNYDIRLMTVTAALIGSVMLLSEFGLRSLQVGTGRRRSSSSRGGGGAGAIFLILWVIAMLLAPLISRLLALTVSRQREYLADASGAELTRNPAALASALAKIDAAVEPTRSIKKGTAHLCIADPLGSEVNDREGFFANLFATHPPIAARIKVLRGMAYHHV
jgi:heat shock protein HtpX